MLPVLGREQVDLQMKKRTTMENIEDMDMVIPELQPALEEIVALTE